MTDGVVLCDWPAHQQLVDVFGELIGKGLQAACNFRPLSGAMYRELLPSANWSAQSVCCFIWESGKIQRGSVNCALSLPVYLLSEVVELFLCLQTNAGHARWKRL